MTPLPAPLRWLYSLEWRRGLFDWARSDGVTWVYIFKVLLAAFLTLWLAMRLELPQPRTAMITVFIVMQPQSGGVRQEFLSFPWHPGRVGDDGHADCAVRAKH